MSTLENMMETAACELGRSAEPLLADPQVNFYLSTLHLAQAPSPEAQEGSDPAQMEVPYVCWRAHCEPCELTRAAGVFEVPLTGEVAANAEQASQDGYLDRLFQAVGRLFSYRTVTDTSVTPNVTRTLFDTLSSLVPGLTVLGLKPDSVSTDMGNEGSVVKRMITGTFICRQAAA